MENRKGARYGLLDGKHKIQPGSGRHQWEMVKKMHDQHVPTNYVNVTSVDVWSKKVMDSGVQVVMPKAAVPKRGYFAPCLDPEGNCFGLWQDDPNAA